MKKVFLWSLIVSVITVFSLAGCKTEVAKEVTEEEKPEEEEAVENEAVEEEPALVEESLISTPSISPHPWPMDYHDAQRTNRSSFIGPADLPYEKWTFETYELDPYGSGSELQPVIAADNTVYFSINHTCGGDFLCAVKPDGSLRWTFKIPEEGFISDALCIGADSTIYVASTNCADSTLYALNPDGTVKWKYNTGRHDIYEVLLGPKDTIFVITSLVIEDMGVSVLYRGELLIINSDGRLKVSITPPREDMLDNISIGADGTLYSGYERLYAWNTDGTVKWIYDAGRDIRIPPVIGDDGTIYVVFGEARLYAINPDGTLKWKTVSGSIERAPAIGADGTIYLPVGGELLALNPEDGMPKWEFECGHIFSSPIIDGNGTIYVKYDRLYAINPDGTLKWSYAGGCWPPVIGADNTLYARIADADLCSLGS